MYDSPLNYRSLELICNEQAALTTNPTTRGTLLAMAAEYRTQAERLERERPTDVKSRD
jgi:hypothetical protein